MWRTAFEKEGEWHKKSQGPKIKGVIVRVAERMYLGCLDWIGEERSEAKTRLIGRKWRNVAPKVSLKLKCEGWVGWERGWGVGGAVQSVKEPKDKTW